MGALRRGFASEALVRTPFFALHEELGGQVRAFQERPPCYVLRLWNVWCSEC